MTYSEQLLPPLARDNGERPAITFYDDVTGARVELSVLTLCNWAAKTANWLRDGMGLAPGDVVAMRLPAHWQTAGAVLGALWFGAHVVAPEDARASEAEVALTTPSEISEVAHRCPAAELVTLALDPMGMGGQPPEGAQDFTSEVRIHGDDFRPDPTAGGPALGPLDTSELHDEAQRVAARHGWNHGTRVLSTREWDLPGGLIEGLLAVLQAGGSVVQCAGTGSVPPADLQQRAERERVSAWLASPA